MDDGPRIEYATTSDGVSIAYWSMGEGPPLVLLPPALPFSHIEQELAIPEWRHWYDHLARNFRVIRYDNRGAGLSDRDVQQFSAQTHTADLQAVVDALRLDSFTLWGLYYSCLPAVTYADAHPERIERLVLWCPVAYRGHDTRTPEQQEAFRRLMEVDFTLFTETLSHTVFGWSQGEPAHRFAAYMRASIEPPTALACWEQTEAMDIRDMLPRITAPTLVMHRRHLQIVGINTAREIAGAIPNSKLVIVDGDSLSPYIGDTEAPLRVLGEFCGLDVSHYDGSAHARANAAGGFRVIAFTDIVGSTEVTQRIGDAQAHEMVRVHNQVVRDALHSFNGEEIKHTGDGIMMSFTSAVLAIECSIAIQRRLAMHLGMNPSLPRFCVRIGMNAGEPVAEGGDLFGTAVQLAARVCSQAEPQQILVSDVVRQLVAGKGFLFSDRGEADLRGFDEPVRLFEARWREE